MSKNNNYEKFHPEQSVFDLITAHKKAILTLVGAMNRVRPDNRLVMDAIDAADVAINRLACSRIITREEANEKARYFVDLLREDEEQVEKDVLLKTLVSLSNVQ